MQDVILEDIDCPNGCERNDKLITKSKDFLHDLEGEFSVVQCQICKLIRTNPRPTPETIGYYYPANYGPYQTSQDKKRQSWVKKIISKIKLYGYKLPDEKGKMLEIGSGSGDFLIKMKNKGWEVEGVEYSKDAAQRALDENIKMHIGALESIEFTQEDKYDLIYGWMVLEHLHQPLESLKKIHTLTHIDTKLYFAVPNIKSFDFWLFRRYWYAFHIPAHLTHFSKTTFSEMANQANFELIETHYFRGMKDSIASLANYFQAKNMNKIAKFLKNKSHHANTLLYPIGYVLSVFGLSTRVVYVLKPKKLK